MQAPAIQNGLTKKIQKAKSGTVGFGAGFIGNSTSPLKLHSKQNSEAIAQASNKGDAHGPDLHRLSSGETSASGKNNIKSRQPMMKSVSANEKVQDDELKNLNHVSAKKMDTQSSELAKIQPTSASRIPHELLVTKSETQQCTELVTQFVDFSSKYGLGYKLSNGSYGVLFNDSTKIITHPNLFHFDYIEKIRPGAQQPVQNAEGMTEQITAYNFFDYPESINKKVVLLQHFKSYLDGNQKFKPLEFNFTKENAPERPQTD